MIASSNSPAKGSGLPDRGLDDALTADQLIIERNAINALWLGRGTNRTSGRRMLSGKPEEMLQPSIQVQPHASESSWVDWDFAESFRRPERRQRHTHLTNAYYSHGRSLLVLLHVAAWKPYMPERLGL